MKIEKKVLLRKALQSIRDDLNCAKSFSKKSNYDCYALCFKHAYSKSDLLKDMTIINYRQFRLLSDILRKYEKKLWYRNE